MSHIWDLLFTLQGRISRSRYLLIGTVLLVLKFIIDHLIAAHFGEPWKIWYYFAPPPDVSIFGLGARQPYLYLTLWAVTIPFFWIGIALTLRRLRDSGMRLGFVFLFFVPIANLIFFLYLSVAPSEPSYSVAIPPARVEGNVRLRMAFIGTLVAAVLGFTLVYFAADFLMRYAFGLFLGVPFLAGFIGSWMMNVAALQSRKTTVAVSATIPIVIGLALIGLRLEGLICLLMAVPLAIPLSIAGGMTARTCLSANSKSLTASRVGAYIAFLPILMLAENLLNLQPPVRPVTTSIVINAPASVVWKNVIAFSPLALPSDFIFRSGIAYPIGAKIVGSGPGAIRYCRFSTGDFVEPITIWDEDHLLAFNVSSEPPSLHELGLGPIRTPHVDQNYMRSLHGEFRLIPIDSQHTLLKGTTWYQDYFWPQVYWAAWSDAIVHRIHTRVLQHVKEESEAQLR